MPILRSSIHHVFCVSIILKGLNSLLEIIFGALFLFIPLSALDSRIFILAHYDLVVEHLPALGIYLTHSIQHLQSSDIFFAAYYLISHGVIKTFLVISLWRRYLWAYPLAIIFFSIFVIYQIYHYSFNPSLLFILLTIFDLVIILLTILEYRILKNEFRSSKP